MKVLINAAILLYTTIVIVCITVIIPFDDYGE